MEPARYYMSYRDKTVIAALEVVSSLEQETIVGDSSGGRRKKQKQANLAHKVKSEGSDILDVVFKMPHISIPRLPIDGLVALSGAVGIALAAVPEVAAHMAHPVVDLYRLWGWKVLLHPLHSPDLSPCDYDLIPKMKEPLRDVRFRTVPDMLQAVGRSIRNINRTRASTGILQLPHHCTLGEREILISREVVERRQKKSAIWSRLMSSSLTGGGGSPLFPGFPVFRNICHDSFFESTFKGASTLERAVGMDPVQLGHLAGMNLGRGVGGPHWSKGVEARALDQRALPRRRHRFNTGVGSSSMSLDLQKKQDELKPQFSRDTEDDTKPVLKRYRLLIRSHRTINDVLAAALRMEAAKLTANTSAPDRNRSVAVVDVEEREPKLSERRRRGMPTCWFCGEPGHLRRDCDQSGHRQEN
ncbi:hypothetical protein ANN_10759 [Periplaneta americana]|uniref:CCHC-type domain-containing protein n=1 Tax=Periplaneta americana TaxID=6978 RepID=A0ABQ8T4J0_PERAM|nr:hypothetical protein ANN_10759 [Periplaneta americana]